MDNDFIEIIPKDDDGEHADVFEVLEHAKNHDLDYVLLIGQNKEGQWYFSASESNVPRAVFSVDQFKNFLMSI